ncbi:MAG: UDP-N-acetylmuramate:L-alanyl-gamma-D-glutamyl-meso-diaminopimelate ligase [Acidiferrobacterales bacterium]
MRIHIIGICGTFMGGLALMARALGHEVRGSDANVYPPMSTQLLQQEIELFEGYKATNLDWQPELVIVGNALSRGNEEVEAVLNTGIRYTSGAQWLSEQVLQDRWVLAVAGTHGKTTTASMLAWILDDCGLKPGFLIGGVPQNFGQSARLGDSPFFVIEADEYDTAFFDKRAKFVHYRPRTLVLNNLEFDHADIYPSLEAIETQFHHLVRTVPGNGKLIVNARESALERVIAKGCWTPVEPFLSPGGWSGAPVKPDWSRFEVKFDGKSYGQLDWDLVGEHNMANALAAIAAARHAGVEPKEAIKSLGSFQNARRRLELIGSPNRISVYDDFAHHPTAIKTTLAGLRANVGDARIFAVIDLRSNSMKMGAHRAGLPGSVADADHVIVHEPDNLEWNLRDTFSENGNQVTFARDNEQIIGELKNELRAGDHVVIMSNGSFNGLHKQLLETLG